MPPDLRISGLQQQAVPRGMQVSEHTGRVHLHGSASGERPLGASLPLDALLPATQPSAPAAALLAAARSR